MPHWLYETFGKADGSLDYEAIWSAVKAFGDKHGDYHLAIVHQLRDAFGGYCSDRAALDSALGRSSLAQPWRDGGCP